MTRSSKSHVCSGGPFSGQACPSCLPTFLLTLMRDSPSHVGPTHVTKSSGAGCIALGHSMVRSATGRARAPESCFWVALPDVGSLAFLSAVPGGREQERSGLGVPERGGSGDLGAQSPSRAGDGVDALPGRTGGGCREPPPWPSSQSQGPGRYSEACSPRLLSWGAWYSGERLSEVTGGAGAWAHFLQCPPASLQSRPITRRRLSRSELPHCPSGQVPLLLSLEIAASLHWWGGGQTLASAAESAPSVLEKLRPTDLGLVGGNQTAD